MSKNSVYHVSLWFMILPTICKVFELKPYGPLMCAEECKKQTGCKSCEFNMSSFACTLRCGFCPKQTKMDIFCHDIAKDTMESQLEHKNFGKTYPNKCLQCDGVKTETTRRSNFVCNRFLFTTLYAQSFFIMDLNNISQTKEVYHGSNIERLADFSRTKVVLALSRPRKQLILYNIEDKTEETVLDKAKVYDMARGETEGEVYVLGKINNKKTVWRYSDSNGLETINIKGIRGDKFEVDAREKIAYIYKNNIEVYNIRNETKSVIETNRIVSMALEHVKNILYIFLGKSWNRLILPNGVIEPLHEFESEYVVRSLVNGNDFYLSYLTKSWEWELFKQTVSGKEVNANNKTLIQKSSKKAFLI